MVANIEKSFEDGKYYACIGKMKIDIDASVRQIIQDAKYEVVQEYEPLLPKENEETEILNKIRELVCKYYAPIG